MIDKSNLSKNIQQIKYPLITDKTTRLLKNNQYTFIVDPKISKTDIKKTIEFLFNVQIVKINTLNLPTKNHRIGKFNGTKSHFKKAMVKLAKNYSISLFSESEFTSD